jgi:hypothetical protein
VVIRMNRRESNGEGIGPRSPFWFGRRKEVASWLRKFVLSFFDFVRRSIPLFVARFYPLQWNGNGISTVWSRLKYL